jgi:hypothetical protein
MGGTPSELCVTCADMGAIEGAMLWAPMGDTEGAMLWAPIGDGAELGMPILGLEGEEGAG